MIFGLVVLLLLLCCKTSAFHLTPSSVAYNFRAMSLQSSPTDPSNSPSDSPSDSKPSYTMYTDPSTGETSRVFDSLLSYPSVFTMKMVGTGPNFRQEMIDLTNAVTADGVQSHSTRESKGGKWESVTVNAMVQSGDMVYELYEKVGNHPDVKFKF